MQSAGGASAESTSELADLLIEGARYNDLEDVRTALSQGVSVDAQDEQGRTGAQPASGALHPRYSCKAALSSSAIQKASQHVPAQRFTWHAPTATQTL